MHDTMRIPGEILYDYTYKQICSLTLTKISELAQIGHKLIKEDERYKNVIEDFTRYRVA